MDKPRHPQVIRPWKIHQTRQKKSTPPAVGDFRHPHASKLELHWKKQKPAAS